MEQINLDEPESFKKIDVSNMLRHIHDVPALCRRAWNQVNAMELPLRYKNIDNIVFLGMGGSAISGDLVFSLVLDECRIPILVHRGYDAPAFVGDRTLVIASSYSGMTEETNMAFEKLLTTGSKKLVMTLGGRLGQLARENHIPAFLFDYESPPRAAFPLGFLAQIGIFQKLALISDKSADVDEACSVIEELGGRINEAVPESRNPAKQIAKKLFGNLAVIYGAEHLSEVATRWRIQLNENSKSWAFNSTFPELNHNAASGYEAPIEISKRTLVIMLRSGNLHPRIGLRYGITGTLLDKANVKFQIVDAIGSSKISQMLSLILIGDYVSYYLALLNGIDPYPVKAVEYLKCELGKIQQD